MQDLSVMVGSQVYVKKIEVTYEDCCQRFSELCLCDDPAKLLTIDIY